MILPPENFLARVWSFLAAKVMWTKEAIGGAYDFLSPAMCPVVVPAQGRKEEGAEACPEWHLLSQWGWADGAGNAKGVDQRIQL